MSVVRLPKKNCDHHGLIAAIVESGLADAESYEVKVEFHPDTFMTTSALAHARGRPDRVGGLRSKRSAFSW